MAGTADYVTLKVKTDDDPQVGGHDAPGWSPPKLYADPAGEDDQAVALSIGDAGGNVYVTGWATASQQKKWCTLKYAGGGGDPLWKGYVTGAASSAPADVAIDREGYCFVTGQWKNSAPSINDDYLTVCYKKEDPNPPGNQDERWRTPYSFVNGGNPFGDSTDRAVSLALQYGGPGEQTVAYSTDAAKFCYVTGYSGDEGTLRFSWANLKYDAVFGMQQGTARRYPTDVPTTDNRPTSLACGGNGNTYATGFITGPSASHDYDTARWDIGGTFITRRPWATSGMDEAAMIAVACAGEAHVTGFSPEGSTGDDYLTWKYSQQVVPIVPESFSIAALDGGAGIIISPTTTYAEQLAALQSSNDVRLVLRPAIQFNGSLDPVRVVVEATLPTSTPSELCLQVESQASSGSLDQTIEFYDYTAGRWQTMDKRHTNIDVDSVVHATVPAYEPKRFVDQVTGHVKARIRFKQYQAVFAYPWYARIDYVAWEALP